MNPYYFYINILNEVQAVGIDWVSLVIAVGGVIAIWVKLEVNMKAIQVRQNAMEGNLEILRSMVQAQIEVDNDIKEVLTQLRVGQAELNGKIDTISERVKK